MRFSFQGTTFVIEFSRYQKTGHPNGASKYRFPYTTVNIRVVHTGKRSTEWPLFRTWTAGCYHRDFYSLEGGRKAALRGVCRGDSLSKDFKKLLWKAYFEREGVK